MPRRPSWPPPVYVRRGVEYARTYHQGRPREYRLGPAGSDQARAEYARLQVRLLAGQAAPPPPADGLTVGELVERWDQGRLPHYAGSTEAWHFGRALGVVLDLYAELPGREFGPPQLRQVLRAYARMGWCRRVANRMGGRVKTVWRWLEGEGLVAPGTWHGLLAVGGLDRGEAPDHPRVRPVAEEAVDITLPHLNPVVRAAVEVQRWSGARPGEVLGLTAGDVVRGGTVELAPGVPLRLDAVWAAVLTRHKTAHHGRPRVLLFGARAQAALAPLLLGRPDDRYLFRPVEAAVGYLESAGRTVSLARGRAPGDRYTTGSYRQAVEYGCDRAFPPPADLRPREGECWRAWRRRMTPEQLAQLRAWRRDHRWHPHQLRHAAATRLRGLFGLDLARAILGHSSAAMTEHYAVEDLARAIDALGRAG